MQQPNDNLIGQNLNTRTSRIILIAFATALVLMVPLVAMQFSEDVVWTWFDFAVAGTLLFGTGLAFELLASRTSNVARKVMIGAGCAAVLLFVWVQLAVGVFGD